MRFDTRFQSGTACQVPNCRAIVRNRQKVIVEAGYAGELKFRKVIRKLSVLLSRPTVSCP